MDAQHTSDDDAPKVTRDRKSKDALDHAHNIRDDGWWMDAVVLAICTGRKRNVDELAAMLEPKR